MKIKLGIIGAASFVISAYSIHESTAANTAVAATAATANVATAAPADADYVSVPHSGLFHKSCVHQVPAEAEIDVDLNVTVHGKFVKQLPKCTYPVKTLADVQAQDPTINGWAEWTSQVAQSGTGRLPWWKQFIVSWTVPAAPTSNSGQLVFMFPGMEPGSAHSIIQPVIQYGTGSGAGTTANNGYSWGIANWYVIGQTAAAVGPLTNLNVGDTIQGEMYTTGGTNCNETTGANCDWVIGFSRNGAAVGTNYIWPRAIPDIYNVAYPGVLEVYRVSSCNQLPGGSSGITEFTVNSFYQAAPGNSIATVTNAFTGGVAGGLNPSCAYSAIPLSGGATLEY